uniref:AAA+ ATPase domain-containing protein n=1 Tax=viral metagenome TaxID=1070528 RepID=A0A6C0DR13_9ZZZZ
MSQGTSDTICLHPSLEQTIKEWFEKRTKPAVFLVGPPGVGKTTLAYRVMQAQGHRISEFNASHTRSGACFRKIILPLLQRGGVIQMMENGKQGGLGVILDEIDGLSSGEKGGLQSLLAYLREWKPSNPGVPVIFISNTIQQRMLQMISRYCLTFEVGSADETQVKQLLGGIEIPLAWKKTSGDLRPLLRGEFSQKKMSEDADTDSLFIPDGVVPLARWCLYSEMDPFLTLELENNDSNLAGLVIVENIPDRLHCVKGDTKEAWESYLKLFRCIQESDYADYWAFFYQTWRLLGLSQDVKLNTMNLFLQQEAPYTGHEPKIDSIRYTPVLTKQSALFNAWKLLCEIADTKGIPIRLTPYSLMMLAKEEKYREEHGLASASGQKKQDKSKKVESMTLLSAWKGSGLGVK